jgi:hypothetical protein
MRMMNLVVGLVSAAAMTAAIGVSADTTGQIGLPSSYLTPGDARKVSKEQICAPGYAASLKPTKESTMVDAFSRYGLRDGKSTTEVLDHLIPVELGGTDSPENLWPEPAKGEWNASQKDALEQKLVAMVCDGTMTVKQAQTAIKKNWTAAYTQYVNVPVATKNQ